METFNFPVHTMTVRYPEGQSMKFGRGYGFGVKPLLPVSKTFTLNFNGMVWRKDQSGNLTAAVDPTINILALMNFYDTHQMWKRFIYPSQLYGDVVCRFSRAFELPKSRPGSNGVTEEFQLELQEFRA